MQVRRYLWWALALLACTLAACAGGSGSSGFDAFPSSENAAIQQALDQKQCVVHDGLTICPADETLGTPTPTPTGTPTEAAFTPPGATATAASLPTPARTLAPAVTATPTAVRPEPTPTTTTTPIPVPSPHAPRVDTGVANAGVIVCVEVTTDGECSFTLPFAPDGFPTGTVFRVASRTVQPDSAWTIGPELTSPSDVPMSSFDAPVAIAAAARAPTAGLAVQLAVLAFPASVAVPAQVTELGETGATYAFVTPAVMLQIESSPVETSP